MFNCALVPFLLSSDAAASTFDVTAVMSDAVKSVQGDLMSTLALVVPALVTITSIVVCVRFGLKWLRQLGRN